MKVEIDGSEIRIKGEICGKERHLLIYCNQMGDDDYYSISIIKDGMQCGCGSSYYMNKNNVIQMQNGQKRIIE